MFYKVLGKFLSVAVVSECLFVLIVSDCEESTGLTHVRFIAVRASNSVERGLYVFTVFCDFCVLVVNIVVGTEFKFNVGAFE